MPTALAPASCASCPTSDSTGPLAAATTTVSPGCGLPITRRPPYAVNAGMPSTPRPVVTGAAAGSSLRRPVPSESACVRHPVRAKTTSPLTYSEWFETSTWATVSPVITSPIGRGDLRGCDDAVVQGLQQGQSLRLRPACDERDLQQDQVVRIGESEERPRVAELRWRQDVDDLKEVVRRDPQGADQAVLDRVRDPVEASLIVAALEDMDLRDRHGLPPPAYTWAMPPSTNSSIPVT